MTTTAEARPFLRIAATYPQADGTLPESIEVELDARDVVGAGFTRFITDIVASLGRVAHPCGGDAAVTYVVSGGAAVPPKMTEALRRLIERNSDSRANPEQAAPQPETGDPAAAVSEKGGM